MYKFFRNLSCLLCLILVFGGCRKKAFDAYYGRPTNLEPPIYQVLQSRGNFTNLLACIDKSGYKATLSAAGYWTFFAPNDAAFKKYFTDNNTSLDKISDSVARQIVSYCLVFNAFTTEHLPDYQSPSGYVPVNAYKRRTAYYSPLFKKAGGDTVYVEDNRNTGTYVTGDNNNKYIPYFYSTFMAAKNIGKNDYNYFWPNSTYTDFNVVNASVVNRDIIAENGVIQEIDQVVLPLPSIAEKLENKSDYSVFKNILNKFLVTYKAEPVYKLQYNSTTGKSVNNVYVKVYSPSLTFAPGNESYTKIEDNDAQEDGFTLFAPTNGPLIDYLNNTILEYYVPDASKRTAANLFDNLAVLPITVIQDFINAHMFLTTVWPTQFASKSNLTNEPPRFDPAADVVDRQFCSNGIFYGVNKVQAANVFSTVYARAYLDPKYSLMTRLLNLYIKPGVTSPGLKYAIFMMPDDVLAAMGYGFSAASNQFTFTSGTTVTSGGIPQAALQRLLGINIVPATIDGQVITPTMLAGDGIAETSLGEYIRWHNNTVASGANFQNNYTLTVTGTPRNYQNGTIYYLKNTTTGAGAIINNPTTNTDPTTGLGSIEAGLAKNAVTSADPYWDFNQYLLKSGAYNPGAHEVLGAQLGANYTVFVPTQAAMKQAVLDGVLPGTYTGTGSSKVFVSFNYAPTDPVQQALVTKFIQYHIINGTSIVPDGQKGGALGKGFDTFLKNETGQPYKIIVFNSVGGGFQLQDNLSRTAQLTPTNYNSFFPATSNYLGDRVVYHQINNYLKAN